MARKKGSIKGHNDFNLKKPQSFKIHHEEGQFQGNITNPRIKGCVYVNGSPQEIEWKPDTGGNWYEIQSDPTDLKVTATPRKSGRPCPKFRGRRGVTVTVTVGDVTVTVTRGDETWTWGMGDLTATVTNGDGIDVTAYSKDVTYNE
jgi:hypothetical protein